MAKIVSRGDPIEPVYLNNLRVAAHGWGVVSGLAVSQRGAGANMSVDVASGEAWINGTRVTKGSTTNVAITAAHASYDRYDLVVINSSGTISVIDGTAAATSYANDYDLETNNAILLAEVYVPATDTTIEDAQITDKQIISFVEEIDFVNGISLEEYINHLGSTDDFTETAVSGNGVATADTTNHEMDLSTGVGSIGHALFQSKKEWTPNTKPLIAHFLIQNITDGAGSTRHTAFGFSHSFSTVAYADRATFWQDHDDSWIVSVSNGSSASTTAISALASGDLCTIVVKSSIVYFYVNGVLVATKTTNLPNGPMHLGASVHDVFGSVSTARQISIDMMSIKRYA